MSAFIFGLGVVVGAVMANVLLDAVAVHGLFTVESYCDEDGDTGMRRLNLEISKASDLSKKRLIIFRRKDS